MPIALESPPVTSPEQSHSAGSGTLPPELKADILLVDDRPEKLLALEAVLAELGQNIVIAHSGKEALRKLLKQDFALILLDVSMPEMDGFETASLIRQRLNSEHTPIIFVTSFGDSDNHITRGYSLGAVDYIVTPIIPEILRAKASVFVELHRKNLLVKMQAAQLQRDLRARQEAERRILHLNQELAERVQALTDVNQELEAFNYSISHDLRAPLRAMSSFASALLNEEADRLSPQGADYSHRIVSAAKYMDALLRDLLDYSRLTREAMPLAAADLDKSVQDLLTVIDPEIRERGATLSVEKPLGLVLAHEPTVQQILGNLVGNGLKFAATDRPAKIRIYTTETAGMRRLWVEDNGIGIRPDYLHKIFGLFERLPDARNVPGTGVGLAIVRKGAERMGGRVGVESQCGQGSRFWVDLPIPASDKSSHAEQDPPR